MKKRKTNLVFNRILILFVFFSVTIALSFGAYFLFNVVFKIRTIEVSGNVKYSSEEILKKVDALQNQNLILCDENFSKQKLEEELPYIEKVEIKKDLPSKLSISVKESSPKIAIESSDHKEFILLDLNQKILEKTNALLEDVIVVRGSELIGKDPGFKASYKDESHEKILREILCTASADTDFVNKINSIDLSNSNKILIQYDKRIKIILGENEKIEYKMKNANEAVKKINEIGELDLRMVCKSGKTLFRSAKAIW